MDRFRQWCKEILRFFLNPHLLGCFGIAWIITNGWAYIALGVGMLLDIDWLSAAGAGYLALLWVPFTPEKLITVVIAVRLLKWLFPDDQKTLAVLYRIRDKHREKKAERRKEKEASGKPISERVS